MSARRLDDDVDALLPWYVTGTLNETETEALRARLDARPDAAQLLESETRLSRRLSANTADVDALLARQSESFELLRQRLHQTDQRASARLRTTPRSLQRCAAAAAFCLVAAVAAMPWFDADRPAGSFVTLTDSAPATGPTIQLAMAAGADAARVQQLIEDLHGTVVAGPSPHNVYLIALPHGADVNAIVAGLRRQPEVTFVASGGD